MANTTNGVEYQTSFQLSPGESGVYGVKVAPSLLTPYLKGELMCSTTRFVYKVPNTVLGIIPLGASEQAVPLRSIASVSTSTSFKIGRFILGLVLLLVGFMSFNSSFMVGLFLLVFSIVLLAMSFPSTLVITNAAGGSQMITVSILDKGRVATFAKEMQNRVFADLEQTRHDEAQMQRLMQTQLMQMQLQNQQQNAQNNQAQ